MNRWDESYLPNDLERAGARVIGAGIRNGRLALGLSQRQLGWRVGVSQSAISLAERGLRGLRYRTLARLAAVLKLPADLVFPDEPPRPRRRLPGQP